MNPRFRRCASLRMMSAAAVFCVLGAISAFAVNPIPTVVGPPVPQAIVPGSGGFTLTVYGANFVSGAVVNWNRSPRSTTFISARELKAQILASDVATATAGYITVTNPAPGGGESSSSYAIVEVHAPTRTINPGPPTQYFTNNAPSYAVAADFTNDGILDLVVGLDWLDFTLGNGDGTFQFGYSIGTYYAFEGALAFGDFNGDKKLDLVYPRSTDGQNFYFKVLLGKGNGKFTPLAQFRTAFDLPTGLVAGDFNRDGKLDLVSAEGGVLGGVFLGNGDGTFRKRAEYNRLAGILATADLNGDGILDLVWNDNPDLVVRLGNGDGTFQKARRITFLQRAAYGVVVNDFNGDGIVDLAFADYINGRIGVLIGNGNGTFKKPVYYPVGLVKGQSFEFAAGDFNSDGKTDLIASQANHPVDFAVLLGRGDGTFEKAHTMMLPAASESGIVVGDFNSDGLLDFVIESVGDGLWVFVQQ